MIARIPSVPRGGPTLADQPADLAPPRAPLAMPVQALTRERGLLRRLTVDVIGTLADGLRRSG